jgi:dTDP-glucose pyrophosphorylase/CBS domain-containing protein
MKDLTINPNITISQAMKALDATAKKCMLVVTKNNELLGTLTDGDLRRSILSGLKFSEKITKIYNTNPTFLLQGSYTTREAENLLKNKELDLIPIVNENNVVVDYVTWSTLDNGSPLLKTLENVPVVIMAGGKGTRLEPFTKILPKPLVPVHEKPIIEHIIDRFINLGCIDFYLMVNYKGRILKAYFEELQPKYRVNFIEELEPLGTAGSLSYLDGKFDQPFFVSNCDIIVKADYASLYEFHQKGGYDVTLVASAKDYIIPYGTCELNADGHLAHINEKPHYDFLINTGLYVLNPEVLKLIPENEFFHITQLIQNVKDKGRKVGVFPIDDDAWIDVGQWAEYKKAVELL